MKKFDRTKTFTFLLIMLLLNVLALLLYWYFMETLKNINIDNIALKQNLQEEILKDKAAESIEQNLSLSREQVDALKSFYIDKNGSVRFIENLEEIGRKHNVSVEVTDVNVIPSQKANDYKEMLNMKIYTIGNWNNSASYLYELEHLPIALSFSEIHLSKEALVGPDSENISTSTSKSAWYGSYTISVLKFK